MSTGGGLQTTQCCCCPPWATIQVPCCCMPPCLIATVSGCCAGESTTLSWTGFGWIGNLFCGCVGAPFSIDLGLSCECDFPATPLVCVGRNSGEIVPGCSVRSGNFVLDGQTYECSFALSTTCDSELYCPTFVCCHPLHIEFEIPSCTGCGAPITVVIEDHKHQHTYCCCCLDGHQFLEVSGNWQDGSCVDCEQIIQGYPTDENGIHRIVLQRSVNLFACVWSAVEFPGWPCVRFYPDCESTEQIDWLVWFEADGDDGCKIKAEMIVHCDSPCTVIARWELALDEEHCDPISHAELNLLLTFSTPYCVPPSILTVKPYVPT